MSRRVSVSPQVRRALEAVRAWFNQPGSGPNGQATWQAILDTLDRLQDLPLSGRPVRGVPDARQLVVKGHRFIYRVAPDAGDPTAAGDVTILLLLGPGTR